METKPDDTIKHTPHTAPAVGGKKGGRPKERTIMLTDEEFEKIKALAAIGKSSFSDVVRRAISGQKPRSAPNVQNAESWEDLSRAVANLNQLTYRVNFISKGGEGKVTDKQIVKLLSTVSQQVMALRKEILEL